MNLSEVQQTVQMQAIVEIIEMAVMVFILIFLIYLMLKLSAIFRKQENKQGINEKIMEKRIDLYDSIAVRLYDILCFFLYMGNWVEITPVDILRVKRELDRDISIYAPLLGDDLVNKLQEFNKLCFISQSGWEHEVKIKSLYELREKHHVGWKDEWTGYFDTKNVVEATKMKERYEDLIKSFKSTVMIS